MMGSQSGAGAGEILFMHNAYTAQDMAKMRDAVDAVCSELGIVHGPVSAREAVAKRIMAAYAKGSRQPLNLVHAGLEA